MKGTNSETLKFRKWLWANMMWNSGISSLNGYGRAAAGEHPSGERGDRSYLARLEDQVLRDPIKSDIALADQ